MIPSVYAIQSPMLINVTCILTDYKPYYNCDIPLVIVIFDQRYPPEWMWETDTWVEQDQDAEECCWFGQAYWEQPVPENWDTFTILNITEFSMIVLGNTYNQTGMGTYDLKEYWTPLTHEIEHIKCRCTWHPRT